MKKVLSTLAIMMLVTLAMAKTTTLNVLLIGDSTTKGMLPATTHPERQQLKDMIATWYNNHSDNIKIAVYNSSRGGETAESIFSDGARYEKEVLPYCDSTIDIVIVRYGINDWFKCKDIDKDFPKNLTALWNRLKKDFPNATYIAQTITPFLAEEESERMNSHIEDVAKELKLDFCDVYTPFFKAMQKNGENSYWCRMAPLKNFPKEYHQILKPYTYYGREVYVDDNSLDAFFMEYLEGSTVSKKQWKWVNHHPNSAGYAIVAKTTAEFLLSNIKK